MTPWKIPLFIAAIAVPIIAGFFVGGGGAGLALGALAVLGILVYAVRQRPLGPIGAAPATDGRRILIVAVTAVEDPADVGRVAEAAFDGELDAGEDEPEVVVLVPARIGFLDRWASDVESARQAAQEDLVITVAALARAGIAAEARVGDEDIVQATEDQLQSFRASEVVLVRGADSSADDAAAELEARLQARFREVRIGGEGERDSPTER